MLDTLSKQMLFGGAHFAAATHACTAMRFEPGIPFGPELSCSAIDRAWRALLPRKPKHLKVQVIASGQTEFWMLRNDL